MSPVKTLSAKDVQSLRETGWKILPPDPRDGTLMAQVLDALRTSDVPDMTAEEVQTALPWVVKRRGEKPADRSFGSISGTLGHLINSGLVVCEYKRESRGGSRAVCAYRAL